MTSKTPGRTRATPWLAATALILTAVNLRPAVTSLGPVLEEVRGDLGMTATVAGLLTSVPAFCFAVVGVTAPRLARRFGVDAVILAGVVALTAGLALRPLVGGTAEFLILSAVGLGGIALVNVLLPVVVKQYFPDRVGPMTGVYTTALNVGATAAAAVTVPLASALGDSWRLGLGTWAVVAATALAPWPILLRRSRATRPRTVSAPAAPTGPRSMATSPVAWALAVFFGLQATAAYVIMGWLPQVFRDAGLSASTAGLLFAVTSLLGVPLSYVLGALAGRLRSQSLLAAGLAAFGIAGYLGLLIAPAGAPWLWAILLGVSNCSFPLALAMIGLRGHNAATVGRLSAFAQSTGYLLSIPGPVIVGALYQHTGTWHGPLVFLTVLMAVQCAAGVAAGRNRPL
ncbi:CynX/NimT family MFS transporter [Cryptosporangium phraense]|uniref:CynX/NimT family MFS transporter n=1 Tax=Cryptosporangium phraense TaxID=2593070 RepID=UPI00197AFB65|nr:MFS transporter [Cryptosporangium phraense]